MKEDIMLTLSDLRDYLRVSDSTIYRMLRNNMLPCNHIFKVGRIIRFHPSIKDELKSPSNGIQKVE